MKSHELWAHDSSQYRAQPMTENPLPLQEKKKKRRKKKRRAQHTFFPLWKYPEISCT